MNGRKASGNVTVFQYGITGLSESTALIQSKARALHESGELLNMVRDLSDSVTEDYVGRARYLEDRSKISDVDYTLGQDGWYYRLSPKGDTWIKVRYGENPAIDEIYRAGWRRSGAFCMSWPALTKNKGIPDRLDVSITGDMSAYERFLDVVEREPRPCEVRIGGIESTNFPDKFVKLDCLRFEGVNAVRPDFKVQNGDRINIKFRPRYPKPNLTPEGVTFNTEIRNTAPNPDSIRPFTVTVENIGGWKENTDGIIVWNTVNQTYGGYRAFESYSNTGVASSTAEMIIKVVNNTIFSGRSFYFWLAPRCQASYDYTYYQYSTDGTSWTGSATSSTYRNNNATWQQHVRVISAGAAMWFKFVYVKNASTDTAPDKGGVFIQDTYNNAEIRSIYNPSNNNNILGLRTFYEQDRFTYEDVTGTEVGASVFRDLDEKAYDIVSYIGINMNGSYTYYDNAQRITISDLVPSDANWRFCGEFEIPSTWTSSAWQGLFRSYSGEGYNTYRIIRYSSSADQLFLCAYNKAGEGGAKASGTFSAGTSYVFDLQNGSCTINGTTTSLGSTTGSASNSPVYFESGKWYWFDAYHNGELVMSLRPCRRKSDGRIGFVDIMTDTMYFPGSVDHDYGSLYSYTAGCVNYSDLVSAYGDSFGTNNSVTGGWERVSPQDVGFPTPLASDNLSSFFRSTPISDNGMCAMMLMFYAASDMTVPIKVRNYSESNWDYVVVLDVDKTLDTLSWQPSYDSVLYTNKGLSSDTTWYDVNISVPAGSHFVWVVYGKDGSSSSGTDTGYLQVCAPCVTCSIDTSGLSKSTHREFSVYNYADPTPAIGCPKYALLSTPSTGSYTWNGFDGIFTAKDGLDSEKTYYASAWIRKYQESDGYCVISVINPADNSVAAVKAWKAGPEWRRVWIGFKGLSSVIINYSHRSYSGIYGPNSAAGATVSAAYGYWNPGEAAPGNDVLICGLALQEADDADPMTCPGWDDLDTISATDRFIMPLFAPQLGTAYSNNLEDMPPTFYTVGNNTADKTALLFKLRSGSTDTFDMYWKTTRLTSVWNVNTADYVYNGTAVMKNGWLYAAIYLGSSASDYDCLYDLNTNTIYPIENTAVTDSYRGYYYNTFSSSNSNQASTGAFMFGSGYGGGSSGDSYCGHNVPVDIAYVSVTRNGREIRRWMPARWNISDIGVAAQNYGCRVDDSGYCITAAGARASRHHKSEGMWEYVRNTFEDVNFSRTTVYVTSGDSSHPTGTFFTPRTEDPAVTDTREAPVEKYARHIVDVNDNANFHWLWRNNLGWVDPDTVDSVSMAWAYVDSSMGELMPGLTWATDGNLPSSRTATGFPTSKPGTGTQSSFFLYRPTVTWKSGTPLVTTEDPGVLCQADYFDFPLEWACVSNSAYIDTGITVSSRHRIKIRFQCSASANVQASVTGSLIQCMYPGHRAVMHIDMTAGAAGWWAYEGLPAFRIGYYKFGGLHSPLNLEFGNGYVRDLDTGRYMTVDYRDDGVANSMVSTYGFSSLTMSTAKTAHIEPTADWSSSEYTWTIGKGFNTAGTDGGMVRIWYVIIEDGDGTVLADLRPYFHWGSQRVYFVDMVSGRRIQGMAITKFATDDNDTAAQASSRKLVPSHSRVTRYFWETYNTSSACGVTGPSSAQSAVSPFSTCHWFEWLQMVALPNMYIGGYENKETDRNEIWIHPGAYAGEKCPPGMIPLFANEDDSGEIVSAGKFKLVSRYKSTAAHYTTADWDPSIFPNLDSTRGREWLRRGVTSASGLTPYNVTFNNANNTGMCGSDYALQNSHVYGLTSWEHMGLGFIESAYLQTMYVYLERPGFTYQDARFNSTALVQRRPTGLSDAYATRPGVTGKSGKAYPFGTGMGQGPKIERISSYSPSERSYWNISDKFGYNREFAFMWIENFGSDKGVFTVGDYYVNNYMQPNDSDANTYDPDTSIPIIKGRYGTQVESGHDMPYYTGYTGGNTFNSPWQGYGFYNTNGVTAKLRIYSNPDGTPTGVSKGDANPSRKSMRCERFLTFSANKASQLTYTNQGESGAWVPDIFKNGTYDRVLPYDTQIYYAGSNSYNLWMGVNIWGACTYGGGWNTIQGLTAFKNMTIDGKFDPVFAYTGFGVNYYPGNFTGTKYEWRYVGYGSWAAYNNHNMGVYSSNPYIMFANYYNSSGTGTTYMAACDVTGI